MNFFRHAPTVGVDVRPYALRIVQLRKHKKTYDILQMQSVKLPEKVFENQKIVDFAVVQMQLQELVTTLCLETCATGIALPDQLVLAHQLRLPSGLNDAAIKAQITAEVMRVLPDYQQSLVIDYRMSSRAKEPYWDIQYWVARSSYIVSYKHCVEQTGLVLLTIELQTDLAQACLEVAEEYRVAVGLALRAANL